MLADIFDWKVPTEKINILHALVINICILYTSHNDKSGSIEKSTNKLRAQKLHYYRILHFFFIKLTILQSYFHVK